MKLNIIMNIKMNFIALIIVKIYTIISILNSYQINVYRIVLKRLRIINTASLILNIVKFNVTMNKYMQEKLI